ncbi:hypothetical protein ZIOFF_003244 [Zingiber officinale]|uniref:RING-type domain-containing protein n=1 Tax=Zingiber officinale TaxID=94328 RepID=A0A8J5ISS9_ZINOF|nr:hypothetical protein ZIOFF_003244 [Zingiber officinale]
MRPSPLTAASPVEDVVPVDLAPWIAVSGGVELRVMARAHVRLDRLVPEPIAPAPRLIVRFCRWTFPSPEHPGELVGLVIHQPFHLLMQQQAWERETQVMLVRVAANYVRRADLDLLAEAFHDYTSSVVRRLPMMSVSEGHNNAHFDRGSRPASAVALEGLKTVAAEEPDSCSICLEDFGTTTPMLAMPCSHLFHAACLKKWLEQSFIDDDYHTYFDGGSEPASAAAVEGIKMVTTEEPDSCSICLEDLGMAALVLAMPCGHLFHPKCLKQWLERSCSCPLCRFSLSQ